MAPTASGVLTGFGIFVVFLQCFNYLIDCYLTLLVDLQLKLLNPIEAYIFPQGSLRLCR